MDKKIFDLGLVASVGMTQIMAALFIDAMIHISGSNADLDCLLCIVLDHFEQEGLV